MSQDRAHTQLAASIVPRRLTGWQRVRRWALTLVAGALTQSAEAPEPPLDIEVTRRATGAPVFRVGADDYAAAHDVLGRIRADLDALSVSDFVAQWEPRAR